MRWDPRPARILLRCEGHRRVDFVIIFQRVTRLYLGEHLVSHGIIIHCVDCFITRGFLYGEVTSAVYLRT